MKESNRENILKKNTLNMEDSRFSRVNFDPRFKKIKKNQNKVSLDKRFEKVLDKKSEFGSKAAVDKYGRIKSKSNVAELKRYYRLEEEEKEENKKEQQERLRKNKKNIKEDIDSKESSDSFDITDGSLSEHENDLDNEPETRENSEGENYDSASGVEDSESDDGNDDAINIRKQLARKNGRMIDFARGEGFVDSSSDEDHANSADESDDEENEELVILNSADEKIDDGEETIGSLNEENIPLGDETKRLAVVNLDWDHVKSKDLFKVFEGFIPKGGRLMSVRIYSSEFGKERLKNETVQGPPKAIFKSTNYTEDKKAPTIKNLANPDEGIEFNNKQLRKYQLERLKYYYAVVECGSVSTARAIYKACDGAEFEASSNIMDLRYIPEDMEFEDEPRDEAFEAPVSYQPKSFVTKALQHTKVDLTWDNDDPDRVKVTRRKFSKDDLEKMDLSAYIASSDSEEEDEDAEELARRYKHLLAASKDDENDEEAYDDPKEDFDEEEDDFDNQQDGGLLESDSEVEGDMEMTFTSGPGDRVAKLLEKRKGILEEQSMSVFELNRKKQLEKKKATKNQSKTGMKDDALVSDEESIFSEEIEEDSDALVSGNEIDDDDEFFKAALQEMETQNPKQKTSKKQKGSNNKKRREDSSMTKEELELLMVADHPEKQVKNHFDAKEILRHQKAKSLKQKKKLFKKGKEGEGLQEDFQLDLNDERFASVLLSHHFAIDPTHPAFKKTKALDVIMEEKRKKREKEIFSVGYASQNGLNKENGKITNQKEIEDSISTDKPAAERKSLSMLVDAVKRKTENAFNNQRKAKKPRN